MAGFQKATKAKAKLRLALDGPAGSGKTYSALAIGSVLGKRIALIDTERGSASKYADLFSFDALELSNHHPQKYIDAIRAAAESGYDVLIIDSLSHAWMGKDGALELVDKAAKRSQSQNSFTAWRDVTPLHNELVDTILQSPCHVLATMRSKMEYVLETVERNGRKSTMPVKKGMAPIQRDSMEYEFDVVCDLDVDHNLIVGKTRINTIDGLVLQKPGKEFADMLLGWLNSGMELKSAPSAPASSAAEVKSEEKAEPELQPEQKPEKAVKADDDELMTDEGWGKLLVKGQHNAWLAIDVYKFASQKFGIPTVEVKKKLTKVQGREVYEHVKQYKP